MSFGRWVRCSPPSIDRLVRVAYLLTGSSAVAEDLVQDAFVGLHRHWDGVRQPSAYLRVAVVNACRAHHRRNRRERSHFPELVIDTVVPETPVVLDALRSCRIGNEPRSCCGSMRTVPNPRSRRLWGVAPQRCDPWCIEDSRR